jgi:uncharacterized membrane protein
MESRAKFLGHPVHQILIVFPLGPLATAVIFDVVYLSGGASIMATVAYWMIAAGIVGGLAAAPFGWIRLVPDSRQYAGEVGRILAWRGKRNCAASLRSKLVPTT